MTLEIYALRNTPLQRDGVPVRGIVSQTKAKALLAYLASHPKPHTRQSLGYLLWPNYPEHRARNNLSVLLSSLRKHVGEVIAANRETVRIVATAYWFDAEAFWSCSSVLEQPHSHTTLTTLAKATALYQQDFLAGMHIAHADDFETWLAHERHRFRGRAVAVLNTLLDDHCDHGRYAEGINLAQRVLVLEPFSDHAHERLIHMLALTGQRTQALRHFDNYRNLLAEELQLTPNVTLQAVINRVHKGELTHANDDTNHQTPARLSVTLQAPIPNINQAAPQDIISMATPPTPSEQGGHIAITDNATTLQGLRQPGQLPVHLPTPLQAPTPPRHFVGRSAEKRYLSQRLQQDSRQPIALVGMGGLGKSALVSSLAQDLRHHFEDGILWANARVSAPITILGTWLKAYGYDVSALTDLESRQNIFRQVLTDKRVLMILDEVSDASRARTLLASRGTVAAVFTTRDLDIAHSLDATVMHLDTLARADSQQLLRHSIGSARVEAEVDAALDICTLLDDLPLAIDITAKRLQSRARLSLADMVTRLRDSQQRLDLTIGDLAVRSSFEVSWQALSQDLQTVFCALAVFAGRAFDAAALAYVLVLPDAVAEAHLHNLYVLSMVQEEADIYYRQHPLLADFAQEKLEQTTNHEAIHTIYARTAAYYHDFVQTAADYLQGEQQHAWLDSLTTIYPNIQAAIAWAFAHKQLELIESFLINLGRFWLLRGHLTEQVQLYQALFDLADTARNDTACNDTAHNNAILRYHYAYVLYRSGDYVNAKKQAVLAFELAQANADARATALAQRMLGIMADETGDSERALAHYQTSMAFFQGQADSHMVKALLYDLYIASARLGRYELAQHYSEQSYAMASQQGDQVGIGVASLHLGLLALERADYTHAKTCFSESLAIHTNLQNTIDLADAHACLAWLALAEKRYQDAKTAAETAVQLCVMVGEKYVISYAYSHLAVAEAERGHAAAAWQYFGQALEVCHALDIKQEGLLCLERIAYYLTAHYLTAHTQYAPQAARLLFSTEHIRTTLKLPRFKVEPSLTPTWQRLQSQLPNDVLHECEQQGRALCFSDALDEATRLLKTLFDEATHA